MAEKKRRRNKIQQSQHNKTKKFNFRLLGELALSTLIIFGIYRIFISLEIMAIMWIYLVLTCVLCIAYFVINQGFSRSIPTESDLPEDWDAQKKAEYIADTKKRRKKAKKILILLIPFFICFFFDIVELYYIDSFKAMFAGGAK